jgi:hypothetical protein
MFRALLANLHIFTSVIVVLMVVFAPDAVAETVEAGSTDKAIRLDGILDEPAWQQAGVIADLTQQDPVPGGATPFTTEVRVLVDSSGLYIAFACHDPEPARIAIHTMQRDGDQNSDDSVAVVLDPTIEGRRGYFFQINAAAARMDGLISGPEAMSTDWDGIWDAATQRTDSGWTAEIHIPALTLRFPWGQDQWGFNVQRYVARTLTTLRWSGTTLNANLIDLQRAGRLAGVGALRQGLGLSITPYGLLHYIRDYDNDEQSFGGEAGGDVAWNITGDLTGYLTINPDFAETEVDSRQVNLTRFPLFFPEKRMFFLEGSDIFEFGFGTGNDFIPFFSRRVGLYEGEKVPLLGGLKLLGRAGRWGMAVLAVQADHTEFTEKTKLFSGRVTYDANENLTLGVIATDGDPEGQRDNSLGGVDWLWRTSTLGGDKNFSVGGWAAASRGDTPEGNRSGWGFKVDYPNDLWDVYAIVKKFGSGLDPALGFLPRPGTLWYQTGFSYMPRPQGGTFGWVRQFFFEFYPRIIQDEHGRTESWRIFTTPFNARTQSGAHIEANVMPQFERLDEDFEIAEGVVIPAGDYNFMRYRVEGSTSNFRAWQLGASVWFGSFYSGSMTQIEGFAKYTTPAGHFQLELNAERDIGKLPEGDFTLDLWRFKVVYAFTPDLVLSSNLQYDSESRNLGANTRFRWTIQPGNDLFVVWTRGWRRPIVSDGLISLNTVEDQFTVKLRWTFRR